MGCEILATNRHWRTETKEANGKILADAFSEHCVATPCQVRDETYIKVKGDWSYLYRAVDKFGKTLDFMLPKRRNEPAATLFFARALSTNGIPEKIVIDKSGANTAGIRSVNKILKRFGCQVPIAPIRLSISTISSNTPLGDCCAFTCRAMDHRFIKRRTRPMPGFKSFSSASATHEGIEVTHMIRKRQFNSDSSGFVQFASLAG